MSRHLRGRFDSFDDGRNDVVFNIPRRSPFTYKFATLVFGLNSNIVKSGFAEHSLQFGYGNGSGNGAVAITSEIANRPPGLRTRNAS